MTELYSHSRLSTFETCKKKFQLRYVLDLPEDSEGVEAFVGKRVHEILERLYVFVGREQVPSLKKVIERYRANFDEHYDPASIRIVRRGLDRDFYRGLGVRCIEEFYHRHYPFDADETLGLEKRVQDPLETKRSPTRPEQSRGDRPKREPIEIHTVLLGFSSPCVQLSPAPLGRL